MDLKGWVNEKFGDTDKTLLDESVYSNKDLRKDISKLEHSLKKKEKKMDRHQEKYRQLLQEGAQADSMKRKKYAQKAKFEKKKYEVNKKQYKAASVKLGTLISIQGMREIMDMHSSENLEFDGVLDNEPDTQEVQSRIMERMAEFGLEMEDIQQIQDALDVPIMGDDIETDTEEEEMIMEQLAASEMSAEQVDIEAEDVDDEDLLEGDIDEGIDIEDDEMGI
jgi:hypothetical protein